MVTSQQVGFDHVMVKRARSSRGTLLAQAFSLEFDAMGVVDDAVEDRVGQCGIADNLVPAVGGHLAGDDQRARVVAILDDFQQIPPLLGGQRLGGPDCFVMFLRNEVCSRHLFRIRLVGNGLRDRRIQELPQDASRFVRE